MDRYLPHSEIFRRSSPVSLTGMVYVTIGSREERDDLYSGEWNILRQNPFLCISGSIFDLSLPPKNPPCRGAEESSPASGWKLLFCGVDPHSDPRWKNFLWTSRITRCKPTVRSADFGLRMPKTLDAAK